MKYGLVMFAVTLCACTTVDLPPRPAAPFEGMPEAPRIRQVEWQHPLKSARSSQVALIVSPQTERSFHDFKLCADKQASAFETQAAIFEVLNPLAGQFAGAMAGSPSEIGDQIRNSANPEYYATEITHQLTPYVARIEARANLSSALENERNDYVGVLDMAVPEGCSPMEPPFRYTLVWLDRNLNALCTTTKVVSPRDAWHRTDLTMLNHTGRQQKMAKASVSIFVEDAVSCFGG